MITTVSLNPSIDHTVEVERFAVGELNRVLESHSVAGGKGINVALTASALGVDAECIGFMYRNSSKVFEKRLMIGSTPYNFVWCEGNVRTNIKVHDRSTGAYTEINEPGETVQAEDIEKMMKLVNLHAENSDYLVLAGSLPPGCPKDIYRTMIEGVSTLGCRCVLDADGEAMQLGIEAKPFMIKPNKAELERIVGSELSSTRDIAEAAHKLVEKGIEIVAVSMGASGALITNGEETFVALPMKADICSTVGAGDAMVAGLVCGCIGERDLEDVLRMGVASAMARCTTEDHKAIEKTIYKALLDMVVINRI